MNSSKVIYLSCNYIILSFTIINFICQYTRKRIKSLIHFVKTIYKIDSVYLIVSYKNKRVRERETSVKIYN